MNPFSRMLILLTVLLLPMFSFGENGGESCRPSMTLAMDRAKRKCTVWGDCKATIVVTAAILFENQSLKPQEVMEEAKRRLPRTSVQEGVILLMSELGLLDLK